MSKQTAVEWLQEKLLISLSDELKCLNGFFVIAKEMEKEQKIDDIVQFGIKYHHKYSEGAIKKLCENAEEYYNETYKNL